MHLCPFCNHIFKIIFCSDCFTWKINSYCLCKETGEFLVRHRRSRFLSEPRPCFKDEALGEVSSHLNIHFKKSFLHYNSFNTYTLLVLCFSPPSNGAFMSTAEHIRLPDDCTVGYIVEAQLGVSLTRSPLFHSHLENLRLVSDVQNQVHALIETDMSLVKGTVRRPSV